MRDRRNGRVGFRNRFQLHQRRPVLQAALLPLASQTIQVFLNTDINPIPSRRVFFLHICDVLECRCTSVVGLDVRHTQRGNTLSHCAADLKSLLPAPRASMVFDSSLCRE